MASVWFTILVLIFGGHVFAKTSRNCSEVVIEGIRNCDECLKCGAAWCLDPKASPRCRLNPDEDSWCSKPLPLFGADDLEPHSPSAPQHFHKFVKVRSFKQVDLKKLLTNPQITFVNSSIEGVTELDHHMLEIYAESEDFTKVSVTPSVDFCPARSRAKEHLTVKVQDSTWGPAEAVTITFEVPCSCECSSQAEIKSKLCNGRGTYACDICTCEKGWTGDACEQKLVEYERGDMGNCVNQYNNVICSNNGQCINDKCVCDWTIPGSQYFDDQCTDICLSTSYYDSCLLNPVQGPCKDTQSIYIDDFNKTRLTENIYGQKVWVNCTETTDSCTIKYFAMKDESGVTHVMIAEPCNAIPSVAAAVMYKVTVPAILGVVAILAAAGSVAAYMVYKSRTPPLPLNDPGYTNIDAEDCTGINPLYKPPTSSFKNPTYGKW